MVRKVLFAFIAAVLFVAIFRTTSTYQAHRPGDVANAAAPAAQQVHRATFEDRCRVGESSQACERNVGRPDRTQASTAGTEYWYYDARTIDPKTGNTDTRTQVVIEKGVVRSINFR